METLDKLLFNQNNVSKKKSYHITTNEAMLSLWVFIYLMNSNRKRIIVFL